MKTYTDKQIRKLLADQFKDVAGKPISDADRAYKRGWRDCIRSLRDALSRLAPQRGEEKQ